jgi:hypothetical protein
MRKMNKRNDMVGKKPLNRKWFFALAAFVVACVIMAVVYFNHNRKVLARHAVLEGIDKVKRLSNGYLVPECDTPIGFDLVTGLDIDKDHPKPTQKQMTEIHRHLPKGTLIHDLCRVDAKPPLVFVLHQPNPRTSRSVELTVFKFWKKRTGHEDLGAWCSIPGFLVTPDGRAIGYWQVNPSMANGVENHTLATMVIENGKISYPHTRLNECQVAIDLMLDRSVPVLIVYDTRFVEYENLTRAESPSQCAIFELNKHGEWMDATLRHRRLIEEWIRDGLKELQEAKAAHDTSNIIRTALNVYLDAETAGETSRYLPLVKKTLKQTGQGDYFYGLIDKARKRRCKLADLDGKCAEDSEFDMYQ